MSVSSVSSVRAMIRTFSRVEPDAGAANAVVTVRSKRVLAGVHTKMIGTPTNHVAAAATSAAATSAAPRWWAMARRTLVRHTYRVLARRASTGSPRSERRMSWASASAEPYR